MKSNKKPAGLCPATGCCNPGDPFCSEHLKPHAKWLLAEIKCQEIEIEKVKKGHWREIDPEGMRAQEFLFAMRKHKGRPTLGRVNQDTFRNQAITHAYMRALNRAGLIKVGRNARGSTVVCLPDEVNA